MTQRQADLIVATVSIAWGASNLLLKLGLEGMGTLNLIALRFGIAFSVTVPIFYQRLKKVSLKTLLFSAILGFVVFVIFIFLIFALRLQTTSEVGFFTSTSVVFIPVLCALIEHRKPSHNVVLGMIIVMIGFALMNIKDGLSISLGAVYAILGALTNAISVILLDFFSHRVEDPLQLGVYQIGFTGFFGLIFAFIFENPTIPQTGTQWFAVLGLALICTAYGFSIRPIAQRYTTPEHTGFLYTLEPVFSAIFGFFFLHEILPPLSYLGAALVLISVPIANGLIRIPSDVNRRDEKVI